MSVVGILGTIHSDIEYRKKMGYPIEIIEEAIKEFKPDVICGEVRPEDWEEYCKDKNYKGYLGPFEYRNLIIPLCENNGIKFVPVDWFEMDLVNASLDGELKEMEQKQYEEQIMKMYDEVYEAAKQSKIPFNSFEFNKLVKEKHMLQMDKEPVETTVNWVARNYIMIARIKKTIENNKGKRILCTVGAEHNYFYYEELKKSGYEVIYPLEGRVS